MAVLQMRKINICAMKENRKKILELLQKKGCLEIIESESEDTTFAKTNAAAQISIFERNTVLAENALEILENYFPEEKSIFSSMEGKIQVSNDEYMDTVTNQQSTMSFVNKIIRQKKEIDDRETLIVKSREEIQALKPWIALDVPMNYQGTKRTGFMLGSITGSYDQEQLLKQKEQMDALPQNVCMQVVSTDKYQTYITCVCMREEQDQVEKALRQIGFTRPPVVAHHVPKISIKNREKRIENTISEIEDIKALICREAEMRNEKKR
jgi:V/A-type H+-transporting ATPase subunit I